MERLEAPVSLRKFGKQQGPLAASSIVEPICGCASQCDAQEYEITEPPQLHDRSLIRIFGRLTH
jgi:hypothetical protein